VGAVLLIGAGAAWLQQRGTQVCLFHRLTGVPCLTCGSSRALCALSVGHVGTALRVQPLASVAMLATVVGCLFYAWTLFVRRHVPVLHLERREWRWALGIALFLVVLNWAYLVVQSV
jgi:hypothetical protein